MGILQLLSDIDMKSSKTRFTPNEIEETEVNLKYFLKCSSKVCIVRLVDLAFEAGLEVELSSSFAAAASWQSFPRNSSKSKPVRK